jgi:hypothetical protein
MCLFYFLSQLAYSSSRKDFDGGPIGDVVKQAFMNTTGPKQSMSWNVVDPSTFANGAADLSQQVVDEKAWAAVASEHMYDMSSKGFS